ncbi:transcriptional regulator [Streptomyces galbus]|nr:transcriptional regulator [Streptomyces galbus]GHD34115.1 hypothetical protein GCM10010335_27670 [Streptomyces galbus]
MTHAVPPPRLPVRDRAAAPDPAGGGGVSPMLTRLAAERATGVLEREHGTLHLADGHVVHAESPFAPGLADLLLAHGTLTPDAWRQAVERADEERGAGRLLVEAGLVARGALEICHLGAVYDAGYFALAPSSTPGRFHYGTGHLLGAVRPVTVAELERETLRRRALLHRLWPQPLVDTAPLLRTAPPGAPGPATAPAARQRAVLALVDGVRTAPDIARALGRRAFPTLTDVRRLAAAGLVAAKPPPAAPDPPPGIALPPVTDPDITLLKRLRDALEAL